MVRFLPSLVTTLSSNKQLIILLYMCFCQRTALLMYSVDSLTLNYGQQHQNSCLKDVHLKCFKTHHSFLALNEHLDSTSALWLEAILNSEITKKCGKHSSKKTSERIFVLWELKQDSGELPCWVAAGNIQVRQLKIFSLSVHVHKWL